MFMPIDCIRNWLSLINQSFMGDSLLLGELIFSSPCPQRYRIRSVINKSLDK